MSNKLSNLTEITSLSGNDLFLVAQNNGNSTYTSKKIQYSNLLYSAVENLSGNITIDNTNNGKIISNYGAVSNVTYTFDTLANLGSKFDVTIVNNVGITTYNTSYANIGGAGNRTSIITFSCNNGAGMTNAIVNGNTTEDVCYWNSGNAVGKYMIFQFATSQNITEAKWYQGTSDEHGTWQWQGSNDGSTYASIGDTFTFGGSSPQTQTSLNGNTLAYTYYRIIGISGTISSAPYLREMEFKIGNVDTATSISVKIVPPSGVQLPGTSASDRCLSCPNKFGLIHLRVTDAGIICLSAYPSSAAWVDTAP